MGVDYDLFWNLNPKSLMPFIKAFELKQKHDDGAMWELGFYVKLAIASNFSKGAKYPDKPLMADKKGNEPMSSEQIKSRVMAHAQLINAKFGKE